MCLTLPAQIITISADHLTVKTHNGALVNVVNATGGYFKVGDWALINANLAVQKIPADEAEELLNLIKK